MGMYDFAAGDKLLNDKLTVLAVSLGPSPLAPSLAPPSCRGKLAPRCRQTYAWLASGPRILPHGGAHARPGCVQAAGAPIPTMANSFDVSVSSEYFNSLASPEALADGSLSAEELAADAEGAALVAALQQQIADQLGVDPDAVTITGANTGSGRRRMDAGGDLTASVSYSVRVLTLAEAAEVRELFDSVEVEHATSR